MEVGQNSRFRHVGMTVAIGFGDPGQGNLIPVGQSVIIRAFQQGDTTGETFQGIGDPVQQGDPLQGTVFPEKPS